MESCVAVRRKAVVWKDYMERIMNKENDWYQCGMRCSRSSSSLCKYRGGATGIK